VSRRVAAVVSAACVLVAPVCFLLAGGVGGLVAVHAGQLVALGVALVTIGDPA